MSNEFLTFTIADAVGAATLLLASRCGGRRPWAWSIAAWAVTAAIGAGVVPLATIMPIAAMAVIIGVGLITPIVGLLAALTLLASPIVIGHQLWERWRRRRGVATRLGSA